MSDLDTYEAPKSALSEKVTYEGAIPVHPPVTAPAGRGAAWLTEGFGYFTASPGQWVLTCIVGFVIMMALSFIPVLNMLMSLTTYIWIGGLLMGCKAQYDGEPFDIKYLFLGFQTKLGELLALGAIAFAASIVCMIIAFGSFFLQMLGFGGGVEAAMSEVGPAAFAVPVLIYLALWVPILMMVWFAPALICLGDVPISKAIVMSFKGCLKNMIPMFVYSLVAFVFMILASIPLMLGWLALAPAIYASIFISFMDIYAAEQT